MNDVRAEWLCARIRLDCSLIGRYSRMRALLVEEFKIGRNSAERAIAVAYKKLEDEGAEMAKHALLEIVNDARAVMQMAMRNEDARGMAAAAELKRKIFGVGEPDRVQLSGSVAMSPEDRAMLDALKLTPAQRLQEMKQLEAELAAAERVSEGTAA